MVTVVKPRKKAIPKAHPVGPRVNCAAACRHADMYQESCLREHITIGYGRANGIDWPCRDYEPREITPEETADCFPSATRRHKDQLETADAGGL
jgi:hypothetical protein